MDTKLVIPLVILAGLPLGTDLQAQIFETSFGNSAIGEYTTAGVPVGSGTLVSSRLGTPYLKGRSIFDWSTLTTNRSEPK
jgi:hypothetical protein